MKSLLTVLVASVALVACGSGTGDDGHGTDTAGTAHGDTAGAHGGMAHGSDSSAAHGAAGGGDMMQQMDQMNRMMVEMLGPSDSTYDQRFIDHMIPHHQGAVLMAQDARQKATHPELKQFAQKVIDAQQKEIAQMKGWRQSWYGDSTMGQMSGEMPMSMDQMNQQMVGHLGGSDSTYDQRFIDMMVPHHQGAVMMAQDASSKATKREIRDLSARIIADQNTEIEQLRSWRTQWYGQ